MRQIEGIGPGLTDAQNRSSANTYSIWKKPKIRVLLLFLSLMFGNRQARWPRQVKDERKIKNHQNQFVSNDLAVACRLPKCLLQKSKRNLSQPSKHIIQGVHRLFVSKTPTCSVWKIILEVG